MHYVYILKRDHNELYIGYTNNLQNRFTQHEQKGPCKLLYYECYNSRALAQKRERKLKHYGSAWRALKKRINA